MIVAILKAGTGVAQIEEHREAADVATAIADHVAEYAGNANVSVTAVDFVGFEVTGAIIRPAAGKTWGYNRDTGAAAEVDEVKPEAKVRFIPYGQSPDGSIWEILIDDAGNLTTAKRR